MGYVLKKNTNPTSRVVNRWFAYVDHQGTLTTRGLAQHMIEHGMVTNRGDVEAVLTKLSECIPELVAQGYGVKLNSIDRYRHYELHGPRPVLSPPPALPRGRGIKDERKKPPESGGFCSFSCRACRSGGHQGRGHLLRLELSHYQDKAGISS